MNRRQFLYVTAGAAALLSGHTLFRGRGLSALAAEFEITKTDAEWKAQLGEEAYQVLRHEDTEYAGSSPLNHEKRKGMFHCAGCDLPVYSSEAKYDSGAGGRASGSRFRMRLAPKRTIRSSQRAPNAIAAAAAAISATSSTMARRRPASGTASMACH